MTAMEIMEAIGEAEEELIEPVLTPPEKKKAGKPLRTALILAAVVALLALAGVAAKEAGLLAGLFPEKFETIEDYVNHIAVTAENDALRLTLHEAVTDGYTVLLAYTVERLDGGSMEGWSPDALIKPLSEEGLPVNYGSSWYEPLDTGENDPAKQTCLWRAYRWTGLGRVYFRLFGLENRETGETFTPGYLEAEAELKPCPTRTARMQGDLGVKKLYTDIVLSPFGLRARELTNIGDMTAENAPEPGKEVYNGPWTGSLELVFRDGEEQDLDISSGAYLRKDSTCQGVSILNVQFADLVDIRQVKALRINGVDYPLEKGPIPRERMGLPDTAYSPLEHARAWTYGDHEPVHPELTAEGISPGGETVTLGLDGIWTDGYTTELTLKVGFRPQEGEADRAKGERYFTPVSLGGAYEFHALDDRGQPLATGLRWGDFSEGLLSAVVECPEKAAALSIRLDGAELVVPLDRKQLGKIPQVTPQEPRRPQISSERLEESRKEMFDSLFAGYTPAAADYTADNGIFRLSIRYLALRGYAGDGNLRAWVECSALEGDYDRYWEETYSAFRCYVLSEGRVVPVSGGGGGSGTYDRETGTRIYCMELDYTGDFGHVDALRLIWTPPRGDRIALDLERTS